MVDLYKVIFGLDSALLAANENIGKNIQISANLLIELADRISELESALEESNTVLAEYWER